MYVVSINYVAIGILQSFYSGVVFPPPPQPPPFRAVGKIYIQEAMKVDKEWLHVHQSLLVKEWFLKPSTPTTLLGLCPCDVDVVTLGNHAWGVMIGSHLCAVPPPPSPRGTKGGTHRYVLIVVGVVAASIILLLFFLAVLLWFRQRIHKLRQTNIKGVTMLFRNNRERFMLPMKTKIVHTMWYSHAISTRPQLLLEEAIPV